MTVVADRNELILLDMQQSKYYINILHNPEIYYTKKYTILSETYIGIHLQSRHLKLMSTTVDIK